MIEMVKLSTSDLITIACKAKMLNTLKEAGCRNDTLAETWRQAMARKPCTDELVT